MGGGSRVWPDAEPTTSATVMQARRVMAGSRGRERGIPGWYAGTGLVRKSEPGERRPVRAPIPAGSGPLRASARLTSSRPLQLLADQLRQVLHRDRPLVQDRLVVAAQVEALAHLPRHLLPQP